ncbi:collagen alpha-1(I) chain-like [Canis lupus familiaris]|uniref:collagen alpha-1(I) chain-like n=1 Tax=Canis lupus familiaris TaxID=9615 RepID=UPI0018F635C6|nr:collagen alpha-1(I) chain-like [Canis lupus familiaris]
MGQDEEHDSFSIRFEQKIGQERCPNHEMTSHPLPGRRHEAAAPPRGTSEGQSPSLLPGRILPEATRPPAPQPGLRGHIFLTQQRGLERSAPSSQAAGTQGLPRSLRGKVKPRARAFRCAFPGMFPVGPRQPWGTARCSLAPGPPGVPAPGLMGPRGGEGWGEAAGLAAARPRGLAAVWKPCHGGPTAKAAPSLDSKQRPLGHGPPLPPGRVRAAGCACRGSFHGSRNRSALPGAGDLGAAARALHASAAPLGRVRPCPRSVALTAGLLRGSPGEVSAELRKPGERLQPHPPGSEATVERRARRNRVQDGRVCPEPDGPLSGLAALSGQRRPSRPPVPVCKAKAGP